MTTPRKFRVWDSKNEQMHYPNDDTFYGELYQDGGVSGCYSENSVVPEGKDLTAMFSTGLTDLEDNEVWEGDIVTLEHLRAVVEWAEADGCWDAAGQEQHDLSYFLRYGGVIGNCYENPELLDEVSA